MARPSREPPTSSALVPGAPPLCGALLGRRRRAPVLPPRAPERGVSARDEISVPEPVVREVLEATAEALGEPFLALRLPEELPLKRYGLAELAARSSATLREGLLRMARYATWSIRGLECALDEAGSEALWFQQALRAACGEGLGRHAHRVRPSPTCSPTRTRRRASRSPTLALPGSPTRRPPDVAPLHRFFGYPRPFEFGADSSGFALPRAALDLPMKSGDARTPRDGGGPRRGRPPRPAAREPSFGPRRRARRGDDRRRRGASTQSRPPCT